MCVCGAKLSAGNTCDSCRQESATTIQRREAERLTSTTIPPIVHRVLEQPGQSLPSDVRPEFEQHFGHDFSRVRVHTDTSAAESARALQANAYTVGQDIVFGTGQYSPKTRRGRHLLAHELAHVVQQSGRNAATDDALQIDPSAAQEAAAESAADRFLSGEGSRLSPGTAQYSLQRNTGDSVCECPNETIDARPQAINATAETYVTNEYRRFVGGPADEIFFGALMYSVDLPGNERAQKGLSEKLEHLPSHENIAIRAAQQSRFGKRPDIVDFRSVSREVYDVTTVRSAADKVSKIQTYVQLLNNILESEVRAGTETTVTAGPEFRPGRKFQIPANRQKYTDPNMPGITFCFSNYGNGVVAYCAYATAASQNPSLETVTIKRPKEVSPVVFTYDPNERQTNLLSSGPENAAAAKAIRGLEFHTLIPLRRNVRLIARVVGPTDSTGAELVTFDEKSKDQVFHLNRRTGKLRPGGSRKPIWFDYKWLSRGALTAYSYDEEKGFSGRGYIRPSIPLLRGVRLQIAYVDGQLTVTAPVPKERLRALPGFRVTEAGLEFRLAPEFRPSGFIGFEVGSRRRPLAKGRIEISADQNGFLAQGTLDANVPGFNEARANVTYRPQSGWEGEAQLQTSLSLVRRAQVIARLTNRGFDVDGLVEVGLPGDQTVELRARRRGRRIVFSGRGTFQVPGGRVRPVRLAFAWDGDDLHASGETGFSFKGFDGRLAVTYHNGRISGQGELNFEKGKAKGKLNIKMSPRQKFSGDGTVTYQLTDNLIGTVGVAIDENENVTLRGALEFPQPIELFRSFGGSKQIFSVSVNIPIPGASIGPVGLQAVIGGDLSAAYQIGPGEFRNVRLETMLNPLDENPDVQLKFSGQLYIGANASVTGGIRGGVAVDARIASLEGTIRVGATAQLRGSISSQIDAEYKSNRLIVDGNLALMLELLLRLTLDAIVTAEAGIGPFSVETQKSWNLGRYDYDPGLRVGLRTRSPIRYDSAQPFRAPSLDQIEVVKPDIRVNDVMQRLFARAVGREVETG